MVKGTVREQRISQEIAEEIERVREGKGYTKRELGEYLAQDWNMKPTSAAEYIGSIEGTYLNTRRRGMQQRLPDYLNALGYSTSDKQEVFRKIEFFSPEFSPRDSTIKPYGQNNPQLLTDINELEAMAQWL